MDGIVRTASVRLAGKQSSSSPKGVTLPATCCCRVVVDRRECAMLCLSWHRRSHTIVYINKRIFHLWQVFAGQ